MDGNGLHSQSTRLTGLRCLPDCKVAGYFFNFRIQFVYLLPSRSSFYPDADTGIVREGAVMQLQLIAALIIVFLIVTFAVQNAVEVSVIFLLWRADASLAVVIAVCFVLGALIGALVTLPTMWRERMAIGRLRKEVEALRTENDSLRALKQNEASVPYGYEDADRNQPMI